jgi:hypothetical protein
MQIDQEKFGLVSGRQGYFLKSAFSKILDQVYFLYDRCFTAQNKKKQLKSQH